MNKADLIAEVAQRTGLPPRAVTDVTEATLATIQRAVVSGDRVTLAGFGTFSARERAPRTARLIGEDRPLRLPAVRVAVFRPGTALRRAVASGTAARPRRRAAATAAGRPQARP